MSEVTLPHIQSEPIHSRQRMWMRIAIGVGIAIMLVQWFRIGVKPRGDFHLHWETGRRMVAQTFIYENGDNYPYPPFWGLAHAPLSAMPMHAAQVFVFPLYLGSLVLLLWSLRRLSQDYFPLNRATLFWATAAAVFLSSRYLVRDMMECGVNLMLVALSYFAVLMWSEHKEWKAGFALGFAVALKCTPALFVGYFLWKRQWKVVGTTIVAVVAFTLSPALLMGPSAYEHAMGTWLGTVFNGVTVIDPSKGITGEEPIQNLTLRPAMARFLMHLPEGHNLRVDHPLSVDFLDLSPEVASKVVRGTMLLIVIAVVWTFRSRKDEFTSNSESEEHSDTNPRKSPTVLWECSAISLALLLYSPITWGQHCVGILPAMYLACGYYATHHRLPIMFKCVITYHVVTTVVLSRGLIGKDVTYLLDGYHIATWGLCGILAMCVIGRSLQHPRRDGQQGTLMASDTEFDTIAA